MERERQKYEREKKRIFSEKMKQIKRERAAAIKI